MFRTLITATVLATALAAPALADILEVRMLNRGDAGNMVFEPAFLRVAPGDTVKFIATDRGHNAEAIDGMVPDGATLFKGKINEEIEVTLDVDGLYAVKCTPHFAMGMVMIIAVGDVAEVPDGFLEGRVPPRAKDRFADQLAGL
ncbi:pseudoazurin [Jannaschia pohangensis]|uniref:Pseudoazurin n=1 Tax=Jannaschia pohangensis TaxID=390807 RepID=A0A1I3IWM0_9RHOB|nr:pseudoazurin [Jannaschia pohangensis]SFI52317.1 pseudoazurin [Jannaschia pohangensis]